MKNRIAAAVGGALLLGSAISVQAVEIAGNVTIASDYSFRGVSQTDRDPAVQGGFDIAFDSGFYVGTWGSNVDGFENVSMELDLYGGYVWTVNDDTSVDVRYIRYEYPGNGSTYDYNEYHAMLNWSDFVFGIAYSEEYFALDDVTWFYPNVAYSLGLPADASLVFKVGYSMTDDNSAGDWEASFGEEEVLDWSVTYSIPVAGASLNIGVVGTDVDDDDCFGGSKVCETRAIVSVSKSL
jgi:uncharacterized protein (TIGR02001 family)